MALLFPILLSAQNYVFGPNVRVNDDSPGSHGHVLRSPGRRNIAARGDTVYVAEASDRTGDGYFHVFFARSTNGGESFLPSIRVDSDRDVYNGPSLALDESGDVHLCWVGRTWTGTCCVLYTRSTDGGASFAAPVPASDSQTGLGDACIAISRDGLRIYVARSQGYPRSDIILSRSTDGGQTFRLPETRVNDDTLRSYSFPAVTGYANTTVMVTWDEYLGPGNLGVHFSRSLDGGATFFDAFLLNDTTGGDSGASMPCLAADSAGRVYVIYRHPGAALGISISDDTGRSFRPEQAIPGTAGGDPSLWASADGMLYVSYDFSVVAYEYVRFVFSPDRGTTFLAPVNPSDAPYWAWGSFSTVTANDQGRVFVAWEDTRNDTTYWNDDIYLATGLQSAIAETPNQELSIGACSVMPNPARGHVKIEYSVRSKSLVRVGVYDRAGRLVTRLKAGATSGSEGALEWNGQDDSGVDVCPGVYLIRVEAENGSLTRQVLFLGR